MLDLDSPAFHQLLEIHEDLNQVFLQHQIDLIQKNFSSAVHRLSVFTELIEKHRLHEEELLMPFYLRAGEQEGAEQVLLEGEHKRITEFLLTAHQMLRDWDQRNPEPFIIELLDHESRFKGLLEHHFEREKRYFFPVLDASTTSAEKAHWVRFCRDDYFALKERLMKQ